MRLNLGGREGYPVRDKKLAGDKDPVDEMGFDDAGLDKVGLNEGDVGGVKYVGTGASLRTTIKDK